MKQFAHGERAMMTVDLSTVERSLAAFVDAFNDLDRPRVEACFAPNVTVFYPWGGRRTTSFWTEQFDAERATTAGPPYQHLQPLDVHIQRFGEIAIATFHLLHEQTLGRRTLVLQHTSDGWKIVHLHASNYPRDVAAKGPAPAKRRGHRGSDADSATDTR
jgi:ketosteroid isomerase-like protein